VGEPDTVHPDPAPDAASLYAEEERSQIVRESVRRLPHRCRSMLRMLFFEHPPKPYVEVAEALGLAEGSIGFIRGRCLQQLKRLLTDAGI
jgi:DNA-directed RNA polymerase specialized sigma24 family protein